MFSNVAWLMVPGRMVWSVSEKTWDFSSLECSETHWVQGLCLLAKMNGCNVFCAHESMHMIRNPDRLSLKLIYILKLYIQKFLIYK